MSSSYYGETEVGYDQVGKLESLEGFYTIDVLTQLPRLVNMDTGNNNDWLDEFSWNTVKVLTVYYRWAHLF